MYREEDADELHALFQRRNMLAVFCKLIVCNVLDLSSAAAIYQFYLKVSARPSLPRPLLSCVRRGIGVERFPNTGARASARTYGRTVGRPSSVSSDRSRG